MSSKKIIGIILAAGIGKRMGCTKQLLHFGKYSLIEKVISVSEASNLDQVVVVLGYDSEKILSQIKFSKSTIIVVNKNFSNGQSSSLISGLSKIKNDYYSGFMFILGDQVLITKNIINKLISEYNDYSDKNIVVPVYKKKRGNPVIFGNTFYMDLMSLVGDIGGKNIIKYHKKNVIEVPINSGAVLFDIDTYKDYKITKKKL